MSLMMTYHSSFDSKFFNKVRKIIMRLLWFKSFRSIYIGRLKKKMDQESELKTQEKFFGEL